MEFRSQAAQLVTLVTRAHANVNDAMTVDQHCSLTTTRQE